MDAITTSVLASGIYDFLQAGIVWTKDTIKEKLCTLISNEVKAELLAEKLKDMPLNDEMSPKAIERRINVEPEILEILKTIKADESVSITQNHFGSGDNVGRDKIVK